jgi:hypothetical protein
VATSGFGVLTTDTKVPVVTETTVITDLLQSLKVVAKLGVQSVREQLVVLAGLEVLLPIQEPFRDFELKRVLDDGDQLFDLQFENGKIKFENGKIK